MLVPPVLGSLGPGSILGNQCSVLNAFLAGPPLSSPLASGPRECWSVSISTNLALVLIARLLDHQPLSHPLSFPCIAHPRSSGSWSHPRKSMFYLVACLVLFPVPHTSLLQSLIMHHHHHSQWLVVLLL